MTAHHTAVPQHAATPEDSARPDRTALSIDDGYEHIARSALSAGPVGPVGLELECHLVDLQRPAARVSWAALEPLLGSVPPLPGGSRLSVEPGGQVELSTPPTADVASSIAALRGDRDVLAARLTAAGYGLASIGSDPARPPQRVNPASRYASMEQHFDAVGCGAAGRAMMASTAALQINVEAGNADQWAERVAHLHRLGPVLVGISACSPLLGGRASGWKSMRQQVWGDLDQARCGPLPGGVPSTRWADYALAAPVMLVRKTGSGAAVPVLGRVSFVDWISGVPLGGRAPNLDDLDTHLSTLFPPVRPRGYLEVRYLDAVPERWWPALAALTVTLMDDPVAADVAAEACEPVVGNWRTAARSGLDDPTLARAAADCVDIASRRCPPHLQAQVERYAELIGRGRTPGDELADLAATRGALAALEEEAHA